MSSISSLVADYGSSDSEEEQCPQSKENVQLESPVNYLVSPVEVEEKPSPKVAKKKKSKNKLANPLKSNSALKAFLEPTTSVFYNPFQKDQEAKTTVLEKHVKLTNNPKDVVEINGKKICWNYRKGRCKFGHKCKYAHDSDLVGINTNANGITNKTDKNLMSSATYVPTGGFSNDETPQKNRKHKPGLSESLIPNKRSRQMYKDIQAKETPWLSKT
ncbi:hypothetical protein Anas_02845 [Armadillidium nasatum]|uniref:C3H1-type domain-containing protein n=1 Tax=Armadillidium nasatum TaxID=96803 RepID=A0A5N5SW65_9CRUS|nr:hypothetical protein Anas_02845 [Armadillidium nasatum]